MKDIQKYLELTFGIDANTSATLIITLFVFIVGLILQQGLRTFTNYLERKRTRKTFFFALEEFWLQVKKQSEEYLKISNGLRFDKENNFEFKKATISTITSLNELGFKNAYEALFHGPENWIKINSKVKMKAFNKIWNSIKSVEFWHEKSFQDIDFFITKYNLFNDRRNSALRNYRAFIEPIMHSFNGKNIPKELAFYLKKVDQIQFEWQKMPDRTRADIVNKHLIIPLRILNRKNQDKEIAVKMNDNLLESSLEYQNLINLLEVHKKQYKSYYRNFRQYYKTCKKGQRIIKYCG